MSKSVRSGKVFIDWSQNAQHKTTVAVYSLRAKREQPFVSLPVTWDELKKARDAGQLYFSADAALKRLGKTGDLFAPVLTLQQTLPADFVTQAEALSRAKPSRVRPAPPAAAPPRRSRQGSRRRFFLRGGQLRLEMRGALKTWELPAGIAGEKRPAIAREDQPLPAESPPDGTYELIEGTYSKGTLRVYLEGAKLRGEWLLERKSGKDWTISRAGTIVEPEFVPPMQPKLVAKLPEGPGWEYEMKLDGYRALALRNARGLTLLSRNNNPFNERFPSIAEALDPLEHGTMIDGEVIAFDDTGRPSFNILQNYQTTAQPLLYYVFDLLFHRGRSLLRVPLGERRALLSSDVMPRFGGPVRFSETLHAPAADLIRAAKEQGLEGFVAKRIDSFYEPGQRSGAWVKMKVNQSHEFVIGGYMPGKHGFDSLLVGYYDEAGRLIFIAKIRNGFVPAIKEKLSERFRGLETGACPFANLPEPKSARRGEALTAETMKKCRWLEPKLVAQIEFADWTAGDHLRHARFAGLREDKDPREVAKERPE